MTIQKLTGDLQNICHSGESEKDIFIRVLDSFYKVGDVESVVIGDKTVYAIKAEPMGESNES